MAAIECGGNIRCAKPGSIRLGDWRRCDSCLVIATACSWHSAHSCSTIEDRSNVSPIPYARNNRVSAHGARRNPRPEVTRSAVQSHLSPFAEIARLAMPCSTTGTQPEARTDHGKH
ncbi:hypothetical protein BE61_87560 [Bradyrhizobium elkanii USDA 61]|nr:hypothetical protein BE61_87560 [Bradyrhizobium elkanii USDA 61]